MLAMVCLAVQYAWQCRDAGLQLCVCSIVSSLPKKSSLGCVLHKDDYLKGTLHWRGAPVLWQQAGVNVEGAMLGNVQKLLRQDVPVCRGHAEIRLYA